MPPLPTQTPRGTTPITRTGPQAVTYHIPHSIPAEIIDDNPLKTTIHLPAHSTWTSGLHYHTRHTEYLRLLHGSISVRLGARTFTLSAHVGGTVDARGNLLSRGLVVEVPRYARHAWCRADAAAVTTTKDIQPGGNGVQDMLKRPVDWDDDVVVEEWTAPSDIVKPLFFFNLNHAILSPPRLPIYLPGVVRDWWVPLQLFVIFWELDNWPVFVDLEGVFGGWIGGVVMQRALEGLVTWSVLGFVSLVGKMVGVEAVREERTPRELWEAWRSEKSTRGRKED